MRIGKIYVDRDTCIGCGTCVAIAPGAFELDEENKSFVYNPSGEDEETLLMAAKSCPVEAIKVFDEDGKQIYP